ncbi:MAG: LytTR family transcriptional regulator [Bacteroidales bacterium]|nr:LytTR family transcriptional regulator [Bacteroidales bacterium]
MLNIFNKPYPFNDDLKHNTRVIFFISIGVFVFLWLFQPFDISSLPVRQKYYLLAGFGFVTFLALSLNLLIIPSLFPTKFSSAVWNIKKDILWNSWTLFTILGGYFLFTEWLGVMKFNFYTVIKLVLTAILPISVLIIVNYNRMLRIHVKTANELNRKLKEHKQVEDRIIYFVSDYQKDSLAIKASTLILIRSANNYIEVFWKEGDVVRNQMVRCSMISAEEIVKEFKFIFKSHRSFVVNINYIERFEGNSQGYKLYFDNVNFAIPVSKTSVDKLKELI